MTRAVLVACALCILGPFGATAWGQTTWFVDAANCPGPGDGSVGDPFCSIQDGIIAAINGDDIVVAPGTYVENINLSGKAIILRSSGGAADTTIDGGSAGARRADHQDVVPKCRVRPRSR